LPGEKHKGYRGTYAGVDLAISASETADDTAVVFAHVYSRREKMRIYILPNPIAKKLNFPAQVDLMKDIKSTRCSYADKILCLWRVWHIKKHFHKCLNIKV
jgi:hypothetical protein